MFGKRKIKKVLLWTVLAIVYIIYVFTVFSISANRADVPCCLCDSFRYHAPCLLDLETGELVELQLYDPHPAKVAELAEEQTNANTFSFMGCGDAMGHRLSAERYIELTVPQEDIRSPALCRTCRKLLPSGCTDRYVLADLYQEKALIPITRTLSTTLRCYEIAVQKSTEENTLTLTVQGILPK